MMTRNTILFFVILIGVGTAFYLYDSKKTDVETIVTIETETSSEISHQIKVFCGDCHRTPSPDFFPKNAWYNEVQRGFGFYRDSGRSDLKPPKVNDVLAWYRSQAPDKLKVIELLSPRVERIHFEPEPIPTLNHTSPKVASLDWSNESGEWPSLRYADMDSGDVAGIPVDNSPKLPVRVLQTAHAAGSKVIDLDQDGKLDLLITDLGSKIPEDHSLGRAQYLPGGSDQETAIPILDQVGRVVDVSPADFDGDGDLDLVVSEFGWITTGSIILLENTQDPTQRGSELQKSDFKKHQLDRRHGTIHVQVTDLNKDGLPDFVALVSQEFETVEAFLNEGNLKFRREVILEPQDPSYGSCGIELVDIDLDGDEDVIYCNGDTLDSKLVKPYHGVHLLVNEGKFPFRANKLIELSGASGSATNDFDGDGDLDIAIAVYLPPQLLHQLPSQSFDALCWLEQVQPFIFEPHVLETGTVGHFALTSGDFNGDGFIDLAVGNTSGSDCVTLWWNKGRNQRQSQNSR